MSDILDKINVPQDLKRLGIPELEGLAGEVRDLIIQTVSKTGGHLAANLGTVELTIALLRLFDPPADKIVWDVSHQTYAYKILTGRRDAFATLRQTGGISGFLRRDESPYDAYGAGHSGTAISAALGMAVARDRRGGAEHVLAVVGDGSLGCGISFEALNNIGTTARRLIVILNDNEMSISENVGAVARHLGGLLASPRYNRWKGSLEGVVTKHFRIKDHARRLYYRIEESIKSLFLKSAIFEEFGLRYIGPIDGHDFRTLLPALEIAKRWDKPILVHVATRKGKGYSFAETEPEAWHGISQFDPVSGESLSTDNLPKYSEVFGQTLVRLASTDSRIVAITAAMSAGTGLSEFAEKFRDRFFDVGISEEHAVVFAAGLAAEGMAPIVPVYSTFFQRAIDCVIHDVCLQNLPVILCLDRAGIVGEDGPTHHGVFDIALLNSVPNLVMMQPRDEAELANMLYSATRWRKPTVIRYPRGRGPGVPVPEKFVELPFGKAEILRAGADVSIWALGDMIPLAIAIADILAARGLRAGVVNARFIRPLDAERLAEHGRAARVVATLENGVVRGGFGASVEAFLNENGLPGRALKFGWPDAFVPHGSSSALMKQFGLTPDAIAKAILDRLGM